MRASVFFSVLVTACLAASSVGAAPIFFTADGVLPGGLGTLNAERDLFRSAAAGLGATLQAEGFESGGSGTSVDFGAFVLTVTGGGTFGAIIDNPFVVTEGDGAISFNSRPGTVIEFAFDSAINAFGIDLTSIDLSNTTVTYRDDLGNLLVDFAIDGVFAGATFFGVVNDQAFRTVRFEFTGSEVLVLDHLEFGASGAGVIPEPAALVLLSQALCAGGFVLVRRRLRSRG